MFKETDTFEEILKEMTGKTSKEIINQDFPTLTPEVDVSEKSAQKARGSVRLFGGRFFTAKDIFTRR